jgi:hypothetical protein
MDDLHSAAPRDHWASRREYSAIGALSLPAGLAEPARSVTTVLRKERCR